MKLIKAGNKHKQIWQGECRHCGSTFEDTDEIVRLGVVESCPREHYEFAHRDCPECGRKAGGAVILYPIEF
jgi:hypothetical protein